MISASEYFAGIYQEIPKAILVYDELMQVVYCTPKAQPFVLPDALRRAAEDCRKELQGTALSLQLDGAEKSVYLTPTVYDGKTYIVAELETVPEYPELPELIRVVRNTREKLAAYLNGLYSVAQRIGLSTPNGKELGADVRRIMRLAEHLDRLVDGGQRIIYRVPMDIGRFAAEYARSLNDLEMDKTILTAPYESGMIARIMPEDLELVLANLVSNGFRFGADRVTIRTARIDDKIRITVADNGPGIEEPARIFEWGYRTTDYKGVQGLGFGLPMAKRVLEEQDAELLYERVDGQTCFHIDFQAVDFPDGGRLAEWKPEPLENSLSQIRVEMSDYIKEMEI